VGIFPTDPAVGFPPGTPDGPSTTLSRSAKLHGLGFLLAFGSLTGACAVFARRFRRRGEARWARYSAATGGMTPVLVGLGSLVPGVTSLLFALVTGVGLGWLAAVSARLRLARTS
jgi:hypothetical protein